MCRYVVRPWLEGACAFSLPTIFPSRSNAVVGGVAIGCGGRPCWRGCFFSDFSKCAACGGRLRIIAALTDPDPASIRSYLEG